jgi:hypothetical protein
MSPSPWEKKTNPDTDELLSIEKQRSEAIVKHDSEFLNNVYDDNFRGVTAAGYVVDKAKLPEVFKRDNPQVKFDIDELEARLFGNRAVVQGRLTGKEAATGKTVHESKYMHVYVKEGDQWRIVAGQGTMGAAAAEIVETTCGDEDFLGRNFVSQQSLCAINTTRN